MVALNAKTKEVITTLNAEIEDATLNIDPKIDDGSEETKSSGLTSQLTPNAYEVSTFLLIVMSTLFTI